MEAIDLYADNAGEPIILPDPDGDETKSETKPRKRGLQKRKKGLHPNQSTDDLGESWLHKTFRNLEASLCNEEGTSVDEKKVTQFFNLYDNDGNGSLSYDEVKAMLHLESEGQFTDEEFRELLGKWDEEHTESLDLAQFKRFIVSFRKSMLKKSSKRIRRFSDESFTENLKRTKCHLLFKGAILIPDCHISVISPPCTHTHTPVPRPS